MNAASLPTKNTYSPEFTRVRRRASVRVARRAVGYPTNLDLPGQLDGAVGRIAGKNNRS
jgi:hypothetical protein